MTCEDTVTSLGVYVVGALDADQRAAVETHLDHCEACRAELAELAGLPALLDRLSIEDFPLEPFEAPAELFDRVAAKVREEDEQRSRPGVLRSGYRRLTAVAAALVLIAGVSIGSIALAHRDHHPGTPAAFSASQAGVTMRVTLAAQASGTGLHVSVSGLRRDEHCRLIAIAKDGTRDIAGRWDATYSGWAQQTGSTRIPESQLSKLVLLGNGGKQLVIVNV